MRQFSTIWGVDFSGAAQAGRTIWLARCTATRSNCGPTDRAFAAAPELILQELTSLERLCGASDRATALAHLVDLIRASDDALWCIDCPFGLPIEVLDDGANWHDQLRLLCYFTGDAPAFGHWCLDRARQLDGPLHIRRTTDIETRTPFDGYHYRIIYQTFHGMRDLLMKLSRDRGTAIAPFHSPRRVMAARRVVIETCPGSALKRSALPHQNYKQPAGGPLTTVRRRTRRAILCGLAAHVEIPGRQRRLIMRNPGGDALDAVIAAVGGYAGWRAADHRAVFAHPRYRREGRIYA